MSAVEPLLKENPFGHKHVVLNQAVWHRVQLY